MSFSGRLQDGHLAQSSFHGTLGGQRLDGTLMLDLRAQAARAQLKLTSGRLAIGELLRRLRLADDIDLDAGRFEVALTTQGTTLRELLTRAVIDATLVDGRWTFAHAGGSSGNTIISLARSRLEARPGQPLTITGDAQVHDTPFTLVLHGEPLELMLSRDSWRLNLSAKTADTELAVSGTAQLPLDRSQLTAQLKLSGTSLDRLGPLLGLALPPLGPYTIAGALRAEPAGYHVQDLDMRIGASDLRGQLHLSTVNEIPSLDFDLQANQLQLEDFGLDLRRLSIRPEAEVHHQLLLRRPSGPAETIEDSLIDRAQSALDDWIGSDLVRHLDARLQLDAQRVVIDSNISGPLSLAASLQNGRFTLERWNAGLGDGALNLQLVLQPETSGLAAEVVADIDRLDYGVLARLLQPETTLRGHFSHG